LRAGGVLGDGSPGTRYFSVNVSPIQLGQPDFSEFVLTSLDRAGVPRSILHLELTESAIMKNREMATRVIQRLTGEGISFKLDDFGTGYSSLGYLHSIPIDSVKVDKSFVSRLRGGMEGGAGAGAAATEAREDSDGVVRGIVSLSHELGKTVVAEGIETSEQVRKLREFACDFGQGYFFGKPADQDALLLSLASADGKASADAGKAPAAALPE